MLALLFQVSQPRSNETTVFDGTAIFSRWNNAQYQEIQVAVTIHRMEVFRMEFTYDSRRSDLLYILHFCSFHFNIVALNRMYGLYLIWKNWIPLN
jgi:hypothetical protein